MSYVVRGDSPKLKADLGPDEGLTDYLVFHSIIGTPGGPGPMSIMTLMVGPDGRPERPNALLALHLATVLLARIEEAGGLADPELDAAARAGLAEIRKPFKRRRGVARRAAE